MEFCNREPLACLTLQTKCWSSGHHLSVYICMPSATQECSLLIYTYICLWYFVVSVYLTIQLRVAQILQLSPASSMSNLPCRKIIPTTAICTWNPPLTTPSYTAGRALRPLLGQNSYLLPRSSKPLRRKTTCRKTNIEYGIIYVPWYVLLSWCVSHVSYVVSLVESLCLRASGQLPSSQVTKAPGRPSRQLAIPFLATWE